MDSEFFGQIRILVFLGLLGLLWLCEWLFPRRSSQRLLESRRWHNVLLTIVNTILLRLVLPVSPVLAAEIAARQGWGLFPVLSCPEWLAGLLGFVLLDVLIYTQHVVFHRVPMLWRLHRVHHSDRCFDVTTALRFHTIEILLSLLLKIGIVILLGIPVVAIFVFEIVLNSMAMFNHSNLNLPIWLDHLLRFILVTPDMHRVHHSQKPEELNRNFGFNLSIWDRMFQTYCDQPELSHEQMEIGLRGISDGSVDRIDLLLVEPFRHRGSS